ncbi:MAG TPA: DUF3617 family protein [Acidiferrobacteraceae bacterium]|nr:DUF3617 family protein [Acidiferrobacteraceae bacterium]HEX19234.1 DUF3617 family protein [Acidiferrobacteraceae bacterium]
MTEKLKTTVFFMLCVWGLLAIPVSHADIRYGYWAITAKVLKMEGAKDPTSGRPHTSMVCITPDLYVPTAAQWETLKKDCKLKPNNDNGKVTWSLFCKTREFEIRANGTIKYIKDKMRGQTIGIVAYGGKLITTTIQYRGKYKAGCVSGNGNK